MRSIFSKYPEMIFCDATYSVNNRNMPLQTIMCVDGEGETQIITLFIIRSENVSIMTKMFEIFKEENTNADKVEIVMVDKHASNLATFSTVFPNAAINLCVFHVQQIFKREITTKKETLQML